MQISLASNYLTAPSAKAAKLEKLASRATSGRPWVESLSWLSIRRFAPAQEVARGSLLRRAVMVRSLLVAVKRLE